MSDTSKDAVPPAQPEGAAQAGNPPPAPPKADDALDPELKAQVDEIVDRFSKACSDMIMTCGPVYTMKMLERVMGLARDTRKEMEKVGYHFE